MSNTAAGLITALLLVVGIFTYMILVGNVMEPLEDNTRDRVDARYDTALDRVQQVAFLWAPIMGLGLAVVFAARWGLRRERRSGGL